MLDVCRLFSELSYYLNFRTLFVKNMCNGIFTFEPSAFQREWASLKQCLEFRRKKNEMRRSSFDLLTLHFLYTQNSHSPIFIGSSPEEASFVWTICWYSMNKVNQLLSLRQRAHNGVCWKYSNWILDTLN